MISAPDPRGGARRPSRRSNGNIIYRTETMENFAIRTSPGRAPLNLETWRACARKTGTFPSHRNPELKPYVDVEKPS